jgi:hypothetical protein
MEKVRRVFMIDAKAIYLSEKAAREECYRLAEERGHLPFTALRIGRIVLRTNDDGCGEEVDYVRDILAPRGLVPYDYLVRDWTDAKRLLGMLPPARG